MTRFCTNGGKIMSRYYSYNDFMTNVVDTADQLARSRKGCSLEDLYQVSSKTLQSLRKLLTLDWKVFLAVTALFVLGEFGLIGAITAFLLTPIGIPVAALFGVYAVYSIRQMYRDKVLPNAVRAIGEQYRQPWVDAEGNTRKVDSLLEKASEELFARANELV